MSEYLAEWFQGFEKGINSLDQKAKESFFYSCGSNCVERGVKKVYEELYIDSGKKLDTFFLRLNEMKTVGGEIINPGKVYDITFCHCICELHRRGYIHSDCICECSRQSIIHVMKSLEPELQMQVDKISTVLGGGKECRFRISIEEDA
ncbi:hypothetical protein [Petrocella sp. FN5]|uniref:hypothetical protein n=1 Tax=Petrocella sp. FN5 TaxID=3032002 RepID=UPI0023DB66C1|nr:hypothetical protein [Petrocella sp. FN5]MDF1618708.1 hypothetical protein [Petrocella sp. FN5]